VFNSRYGSLSPLSLSGLVVGMEPRASHMLGWCSTTELHLQAALVDLLRHMLTTYRCSCVEWGK
jgi:hypothetical protein